MAGINKTITVGRAGKDPETKFLPNGDAVVNFSLATSEAWKDKESGQKNEITEWHNFVAFKKPAEIIAQYLKKGDMFYVEGKNKTRSWVDKNSGVKMYRTEIIVNNFQFLGGKSDGGQSADNGQEPQQDAPQQERGAKARYKPPSEATADLDDDIPF